MNEFLLQVAVAALPVIFAITLHEVAHGYAALALGDDTAKQQGRLSLNPARHVDLFGTILLPGFLIVAQLLTIGRISFLFGWAKPVPVAAWRFRNPRRGMALVAAAGPAANFVLAWLAALGFHGTELLGDGRAAEILDSLIFTFVLSNLVLGLFNLLPLPPLDGGRIAVGLLPLRLAAAWARMERAGILVVVLLVFLLPRALAEFGVQFDPVGDTLNRVLPWAFHLVSTAAGLDG